MHYEVYLDGQYCGKCHDYEFCVWLCNQSKRHFPNENSNIEIYEVNSIHNRRRLQWKLGRVEDTN